MKNNISYNESQLRAIAHGEGPALVLAGPGSGKTAVITERIHQLLQKSEDQKGQILVLTFTRAAAAEMRQRFFRMSEKAGNEGEKVRFGTFHSVFWWILSTEKNLKSDSFLADWEQRLIVRRLIKNPSYISDEMVGQYLDLFSHYRLALEKDRERLRLFFPELVDMLKGYEQEKKKRRKVDYDDMARGCDQLLKESDEIRKKWQVRFDYILVDEFQDINLLQYQVLKKLCGNRNLFVVGDDDQSIYGFRGSDPKIMKQFLSDYPESGQYELSVNYRSGREIVDLAGRLIANNQNRMIKHIRTGNRKKGTVSFLNPRTEKEQVEMVIGEIRKSFKNGVPWDRIAVLTRRNRNLEIIAEELSFQGIPCKSKGKKTSWKSHEIVRDIMAYISLALGPVKRPDFIRIMNKPLRKLDREALHLPEFYTEELSWEGIFYAYSDPCYDRSCMEELRKLERQLKTLKWLTPDLAIDYIRKVIGYEENGGDARVWNQLDNSALQYDSLRKWMDYLRIDTPEECRYDDRGVVLTTFHGAKGLEFHTVILPDLTEGTVPGAQTDTDEEMEEERRMFYVALTRAQEKLILSIPVESGGKKHLPSRFVQEIRDADMRIFCPENKV